MGKICHMMRRPCTTPAVLKKNRMWNTLASQRDVQRVRTALWLSVAVKMRCDIDRYSICVIKTSVCPQSIDAGINSNSLAGPQDVQMFFHVTKTRSATEWANALFRVHTPHLSIIILLYKEDMRYDWTWQPVSRLPWGVAMSPCRSLYCASDGGHGTWVRFGGATSLGPLG